MKIALLTMAFIVIGLVGLSVLVIAMFLDQTLFVRFLIAVGGILLAILTIFFISLKTDYQTMWKYWRNERRHTRMMHGFEKYPEYMELRQMYPLAIRRYEQDNRHRSHPLSEKELVRNALKLSEAEWAEREEFRRQTEGEEHLKQRTYPHI